MWHFFLLFDVLQHILLSLVNSLGDLSNVYWLPRVLPASVEC